MSLVDEFVATEENSELFERVMHVTRAEEPVRMFVYGPSGSGKSTLAQTRGRERDLLSDKDVMFCHAEELVSFFNLGNVGERFLERAGTADVLLLDGFDRFLDGDAVRAELATLLLRERNRQDLSTIVFSALSLADIPFSSVADELSQFERWRLAPLDEGGRMQLAHAVHDALHATARGSQRANRLSEEALEYVATTREGNLPEMKSVLRFLVTEAPFKEGEVVGADLVGVALGDQPDVS